MRPYVVRQGEHLLGIAARLGFDPEEVWNHEENRELRELRERPQVLAPGDLLFVPETAVEPCAIEAKTTNRYRAPMPRARLELTLRSGSEVLRNEPYRLEGLRVILEGTSDGDGKVSEEVPAHVRELRLVLPNQSGFTTTVEVGRLDPGDTRSGTRQRLQAIGQLPSLGGVEPYSPPPLNRDEEDAASAEALRRFQEERGAEPTGELDDDTRAALEEDHGA